MIFALHNKEDFIYAYVVFDTVDEKGKWKDNGPYIYIKDMWVHPAQRNKNTLVDLYTHIYTHPQTGNAREVYWERGKYGQRPSGPYSKHRLMNMGGFHNGK